MSTKTHLYILMIENIQTSANTNAASSKLIFKIYVKHAEPRF